MYSHRDARPDLHPLGQPDAFLAQGWELGLARMSLGERATLVISAAAGYGARGGSVTTATSLQSKLRNSYLVRVG